MSYKLIPRFYYSLSIFKNLFPFISFSKKIENDFINRNYYQGKITFTNYGRTSLRLLLSSIGKEKLKVGVQVYTCHTIFQAIKKAGHDIVFLDINNEFGLDLEDLKLKAPKIDVLIVTHTFGIPDSIKEIRNVLENKIIIEDCCHSFLSKYENQFVGTHFDASFFSFGLGKLPPVGQGGFCILNNPTKFPLYHELYRELKFEPLRKEIFHYIRKCAYSLALKKPLYGFLTHKLGKKLDSKFDFINKYNFKESKGFRIDQISFLKNQAFFEKLLLINKKHLEIFSQKNSSEFKPRFYSLNKNLNNYIIPFLTNEREELLNFLLINDVESGRHFHNSIKLATNFGYNMKACPNTENIINKIITIPLHYGVKQREILKIANLLNQFEK